MWTKIKNFFYKLIPTKRRLIQLYAALLYNANIKGFVTGKIFEGDSKAVCLPGFNCYSCPGAIGACPLGSIQNALASSKTKYPTYVLGIILLYSIILGRTICGYLCPLGLVQELLYKIKTPKLKKNKVTRILSYFKYVLLVVLVILIPLIYGLQDTVATVPGFCKYICPAGTFEGGIFLLSNSNNTDFFGMLGQLFTWKFALLVIFAVASIFIFRFFCRFFCPLGAIYGLFNKLSIIGVKVDKSKCNHCQACVNTCKMDVKEVGDHECINCGECKNVCHCNAISWKTLDALIKEDDDIQNEDASLENNEDVISHDVNLKADEVILAETNEAEVVINEATDIKLKENKKKKISKRKLVNIISGTAALVVLIFAFIYANFIVKDAPSVGNQVGNTCLNQEIGIVGSDETFQVSDHKGKIVVLNFWYTDCQPCKEELPHFNKVYEEYKDVMEMIVIHEASIYADDPEGITKQIFKICADYSFTLGYDSVDNQYFKALGGKSAFPMTVIVDQDGIITLTNQGKLEEADLRAEIERLLK